MTYSLGVAPEITRQTATWWKLVPGVIAWLRAAYPSDDFIGSIVAKAESAGPVFIGTTGDGSRLFFIDKDRHGSYAIPGVKYTAPGGADARPLTYEAVRAVFAAAPDTDPSTKPMLATSNITIDAPNRPSTKWPVYVGLGLAGLAVVGIAYVMTRKPAPTPTLAKNRRLRRNSSFGPARDSAAARARAAFARGDGAAASRALAELRAIDIGLMPGAIKRNDSRWNAERYARAQPWWNQPRRTREEQAIDWYLSFIDPGATYDDHVAAMALTAERYPDVDLKSAMRRLARNPGTLRRNAYAIPERHAYPITTAKDAYHATQRLKQGRVKSEAEAKRIIAAIKHRYPEIWRDYLAGYPVSKIVASKRKGLAARHRS